MIVFLIICEISDDLDRYLSLGHVWLIDIGQNVAKEKMAWAQAPKHQLTTFRAGSTGDEERTGSTLSSIYEHHPDWSEIRIVRYA